MRHVYYVMLVLFTVCITSTVNAEISCSDEQRGTVVVYSNGMLGTKQGAEDSEERIEELLRASLPAEEFSKLKFGIAYNKSYGLLEDLYESAKQKFGAGNAIASFWRWVGDLNAMPDVLQKSAKDLASSFNFSTRVAPGELANHVALYRTSITEGNKVLVVSHSQGNFFVNAAYKNLFEGSGAMSESGSFGIIAVATPASYVAGGGIHTTLVEDGVIAAIRLATPAGVSEPLSAYTTNILSGAISSDIYGHLFVDEYMATGSRSVKKIKKDILFTISSLVAPPPQAQSGIITATLTWGEQPDVDLHTFEPNGTHVYYSNRYGVSGYLDLDDISSYGPEHYYVSCDSLEIGTYSIGVNYFNGSAPETALVQISAGSSVRSFRVDLQSAAGFTGNDSPVLIADVIVSVINDKYNFRIQNPSSGSGSGGAEISFSEF